MNTAFDTVSSVGTEALPLFVEAMRSADPMFALFREIDQGLARSPGHQLLTVLVYFRERGESQRAYSSRPDEYPVGGRKTLGQAPRMRQVLTTAEPLYAVN